MQEVKGKELASGDLVNIGGKHIDCYAFVPNPLPPHLDFDLELVTALSSADRAVCHLAGAGGKMRNANLLMIPFMLREAVLSSRIEGTQAGLEDIYAFQVKESSQFSVPGLREPASDTPEVMNYVRAMAYGKARLTEMPVSIRLFNEIHKVLLEGARGASKRPGELRRKQVWIGQEKCQIEEARYVPPPPAEMRQALHDLENYVHTGDSFPPLIRLGLIHYQFEAIHPYEDGNGRLGRLVIPFLLIDWGIMSLPLLYVSPALEREREKYYDLLLGVSERGEWREWLLFFLRAVADQALDVSTRVKSLEDLQGKWHAQLIEMKASSMVLSLADSLFELPIVTIPSAEKRLGVTYHTARNYVSTLEKAGIVRQLGDSSYNKVFVADEIHRAVLSESDPQLQN